MLTVVTLGIPSHLEGINGLKQLKPVAPFKVYYLSNFYALCWAELPIHCPPPIPQRWSGQLTKTLFFVNSFREPDDPLVQLSYLKPRLPSSPPGIKVNSACFILHSSLSLLVFALLWALFHCGNVLAGYTAELPKPLLSPEACGCWWPYHLWLCLPWAAVIAGLRKSLLNPVTTKPSMLQAAWSCCE